MNNIKNKLVIFLKKTYIRYIIFVLFGFLIGWLVFVGFVTKKEFKKYYFSSGNIQIETKNTLACSSISESSVSTYNNKVYSEANKSPLDKFSVGIDLLNKKLSFITSLAVENGINEPDQYNIISYTPNNITAVGYSGQTLVTVVLSLKEGTVLVTKSADFMGHFGSVWIATCY